MTLDVAAVMGIPFSGCETCDEVVVMGESSAEDISWAWETHRRGKIHLNGGKPPLSTADPAPSPTEAEDDVPQLYAMNPSGPWQEYAAVAAGI